jgi:hypothetical protein
LEWGEAPRWQKSLKPSRKCESLKVANQPLVCSRYGSKNDRHSRARRRNRTKTVLSPHLSNGQILPTIQQIQNRYKRVTKELQKSYRRVTEELQKSYRSITPGRTNCGTQSSRTNPPSR